MSNKGDNEGYKRKKDFLIPLMYRTPVKALSDSDAGIVFKALLDFAHDGQKKDIIPPMALPIYLGIVEYMSENYEKWLIQCKINEENGKKGGRPKEPK